LTGYTKHGEDRYEKAEFHEIAPDANDIRDPCRGDEKEKEEISPELRKELLEGNKADEKNGVKKIGREKIVQVNYSSADRSHGSNLNVICVRKEIAVI